MQKHVWTVAQAAVFLGGLWWIPAAAGPGGPAVGAIDACRVAHPDRSLSDCEQPVFAVVREAQDTIERDYPTLVAGLAACRAHFVRQDESTHFVPIFERGFGACAALGERYDTLSDQLVVEILRSQRQRDRDAVRRAAGAQ
jgi:hypothetical protein